MQGPHSAHARAGVRYYNHSQPWVSHVSLQGHDVGQLDMAKTVWTQLTPKPIVWDEVSIFRFLHLALSLSRARELSLST